MKQTHSWRLLLLLGLGLACALGTYWWLETGQPTLAVSVAAATLIAVLPLPWLLARPLVLWRAQRQARALGITLTDKNILAELALIDTLVISRRGTITSGQPYIANMIPEGLSRNALISLAAAAEQGAGHPIGQAIVAFATAHELTLPTPATCNELPGRGVEAMINRLPVRVGRPEWLQKEGIELDAAFLTRADQISTRGRQPIFVANGQYIRGILIFDDEIADSTIAAIHSLQRAGMRVVLLTADNQRLARATEKRTQVDAAQGNLTPTAKAQEVQNLRLHGETVAVLADAAEEEAALAQADLALTGLTLPELAQLLPRSQHTAHRLRQGHILALLCTLVLLALASGLVHTFGGPLLGVAGAAAGLGVSCLIVALNSLRS